MQNKRKATDFFGSLRWRMVGIYLLVTVLVLVAISSLVSSLMEEFLVSHRTSRSSMERCSPSSDTKYSCAVNVSSSPSRFGT